MRIANAWTVDAVYPEGVLEGEVLEDDGVVTHAAQSETK